MDCSIHYDSDSSHHVLLCKQHGYALIPDRDSILNHIRLYHARSRKITKNLSLRLSELNPAAVTAALRCTEQNPPPGWLIARPAPE